MIVTLTGQNLYRGLNAFPPAYATQPILATLAYQTKVAALQRHLKCIGLFCRLAAQGKVRYLK